MAATDTANPLSLLTQRSNDILASLVVFLVALPLCMGIAIASGAPPALGLITGIIGGLVVGTLAGSPLQVSGPAAGLAVLVFQLVDEQGLEMLGPVCLIAGGLQLIAGILKLGQWFRAISPSVIHGMLAGIGVLIFASQFHVMLDAAPVGGGIQNLIAIPGAIWNAVTPSDDPNMNHHWAALVGVLTIGSTIAWNRFKPQNLKMIPAPLVAVIVGSVAAVFLQLPVARVDVPAGITESLNIPTVDALARIIDPEILLLGFVFAFVASAETLLCATAVDQMHTGVRTQYSKELRAQGVGNLLCGVVGALPMTGVIVRSTANVEAGATTRLSAILHGAWLLLTVAALPWLLNNIPTSALAAILVYTGYKLVNITRIRKIAEYGKTELGIYLATLGGIVAVDLLTGVILGFALATVKLIYSLSQMSIRVEHAPDGPRTDIFLEGSATFFSIPKLGAALETVAPGSEVHVHFEHLGHIDHACLDMLSAWERQHKTTGGALVIEWRDLVGKYAKDDKKIDNIALSSNKSHKAA
ncbi:MAG: SulP family inorganic anion transporter [Maricaulaceae bacterium]